MPKVPTKVRASTKAQVELTPLIRQGNIAPTGAIAIGRALQGLGSNIASTARRFEAVKEQEEQQQTASLAQARRAQNNFYEEYQKRFIQEEKYKAERKLNQFGIDWQRYAAEQFREAEGPAIGIADRLDTEYTQRANELTKDLPEEIRDTYRQRLDIARAKQMGEYLKFEYSKGDDYYRDDINTFYQDALKTLQDADDPRAAYEEKQFDVLKLIEESNLSRTEKNKLSVDVLRGLAGQVYRKEYKDLLKASPRALPQPRNVNPALSSLISGESDEDKLYYARLAQIESSGNPNAKNGQHEGIFQIGNAYAKQYGVTNRRNVADSFRGVKAATVEAKTRLRTVLGRDATPGELYLAHQQGQAGATALLTNREAKAVDVLRAAGNPNPKASVTGNGGDANMTAGEFADYWINRFEGAAVHSEANAASLQPKADIPIVFVNEPGRVSKPSMEGTDPEVFQRFKQVQDAMGIEIPVVSAHRDEETNRRAGGAKNSQHIHGQAIDLRVRHLTKEQRIEFIRLASAAGFTGIGVYENSIHIDLGPRRTWGPGSTTWAKEVITAHKQGKTVTARSAFAQMEDDPIFNVLTFEDRNNIRGDASGAASQELAAEQKARKQQIEIAENALLNEVAYGEETNGLRQKVDDAVEQGLFNDYEDRKKIEGVLDKRLKDIELKAESDRLFSTPNPVFNKDNEEHVKMVEAQISEAPIADSDQEYFVNTVIPVVDKSKIIPEQVSGTLQAMLASDDPLKAKFALDAMTQLRSLVPDEFATSFGEPAERAADFYDRRKAFMPAENIIERIRFMNDPKNAQIVSGLRNDFKEQVKENPQTVDRIVKNIYGITFGRDPAPPVYRTTQLQLEQEAQQLMEDNYVYYQNFAEAEEATEKQLKQRWGPWRGDSDVMQNSYSIMKYPPDKVGYKPIINADGEADFNWITRQLALERQENIGERFELLSDEQTERQILENRRTGRFVPPSYQVLRFDENGRFVRADEERIFFKMPEEEIQLNRLQIQERAYEEQIAELRKRQFNLANATAGTPNIPKEYLEEIAELEEEINIIRERHKQLAPEIDEAQKIIEPTKADQRKTENKKRRKDYMERFRQFNLEQAERIRPIF